jgi:ribosomal protein S18 acetylase RimI-like enzyme
MSAPDTVVAPAATDAEILACFPVMQQLRPKLPGPDAFLAQVRRQERQGYRLTVVRRGAVVVAAAGWRLSENLIRGPFLYIDDLVTLEAERSHGHGDRLFDAMVAEARAQRCKGLVLDSGVTNAAAHRFYFRKRMAVTALHFALPLD